MNAEIHTLTGAYAMDALSETERAMFEHHMAECASCAAEVGELRETAGRLGAAVAVSPPDSLKRQVMAAARRTRQLPPTVASPASRRMAPRWQVWAAGVAAAACLVAAVAFGVQWAAAYRQLDQGGARATQAEQQLDAVLSVLSAPDAKVATATTPGGGTATTVVSHGLGKVVFLARGVPSLAEDRSYQLWAIEPSGARSLGVLASGADLGPVVGDLAAGQTAIGLTVEPRGGSPQPTTSPLVLMSLPA